MSDNSYYNEQYYSYAQNIAQKRKSTQDFLDANPMYQDRYIQISKQYPILPTPVVDGIARSGADIDSNACQAIVQKYSDEMVKQICDDYNYAKANYSMKGIEDEHKMHLLDLATFGAWGYGMQVKSFVIDKIIPDSLVEEKDGVFANINEWAKNNRAKGPGQGSTLWKGRWDNPVKNIGNSLGWYLMSVEALGQKIADRVPGGSIYAYAKQMNAYDEMLSSGIAPEVIEKNLHIKFSYKDLAEIRQRTEGKFGRKQNIFQELSEFTEMWNLAKEQAGEHYITEFNRQMIQQKPVNFRRNFWLDMGSIKAEDTPYWDYLTNVKRYPPEMVKDIIYSDIGVPVKNIDDHGEINYRSLQNPHEIYAWANREFNDNPNKALEYAQRVDEQVLNKNKIIQYSPGRSSAADIAPVGSTMYNIISGTIDGAYRIAPEVLGGGFVKRFKYASKLSKTPADDVYQMMKTGVHPVTKEPVILTRKHAKQWGSEWDESYSRFSWQSNPQIRAARKAGKEARKEFKIVNARVAGWFAQTTDELIQRPFMQTFIKGLAETDNVFELKKIAVLENMPYSVLNRIANTTNHSAMSKIWKGLLTTGEIGIKNFEYKLPVAGLQAGLKGSSFLLNNTLNKIYEAGIEAQKSKNYLKKFIQAPALRAIGSETAMYPSIGTQLGRVLNPIGKRLNRITEHITPNKADVKARKGFIDNVQAIDDGVLDVLENTGKLDFKKHLGFMPAFTRGLSSYWNRMAGMRPDDVLSMSDREGAFTNLYYKLSAEDWSSRQADQILKEFGSIMYSDDVGAWNSFMLKQLKRDMDHVKKQDKGQFRVLKQFIKQIETGIEEGKYLIDSFGEEVFIDGMPFVEKATDFGPSKKMFVQGATQYAEFTNHSIRLFNSAHMRKLMGNTFVNMEDFFDIHHYDRVIDAWKDKNFDYLKWGKIPIYSKFNGQNHVAVFSDFWISKLTKPSWLFRRALTVRPGLDEQIRFMLDPDLTSVLNPIEFTKFFMSGGKKSTAKTLLGQNIGKVVRKMIDEGEDPSNMLTSLEMSRVYGANYTFEGFDDFRKLMPKNIEMEVLKWNAPKYVNHKLSQLARLRYSPLEKKVAELGWGDELFKWWNSPEAYELKKQFVKGSGDKYKFLLDPGQEALGLKHLRAIEAKIRMATGHLMKKGTQEAGVVDAQGVMGEIIDIGEGLSDFLIDNISYRGNQILRNAIWDEKGLLKKGKEIGSENLDDYVKFTPFRDDWATRHFNSKDQRHALKELKKYIDSAVDDGFKDGYGDLIAANAGKKKTPGEIGLNWWDSMLSAGYERFLTLPLGDLHRATAFKQYRQFYLNYNFKEYSKEVQKHFIDQAVAEAIPKRLIDEMRKLYDKGIHGVKDKAEVIESAARSFAASQTMELLYDSAKRHRVSDMFRHIFPFPELWFEVMKSYSRLIAKNPYGVRTASLGVKGVRGSEVLAHRDQGFISKDPSGSGADVYLLLFSSWMSGLVYGDNAKKNYLTNNGYVSGVNLIAQNQIPGAVPWVEFQIDKVLPDYGTLGEAKRNIQGGFPGPETIGQAVSVEPNWLTLLRAANVPRVIMYLLGHDDMHKNYLDFDTDTSNHWEEEHSALDNKRAKKTIEVAQGIFLTNQDEVLLAEGELDRYLKLQNPSQHEIFTKLGKPEGMRKTYFTPEEINDAVLSYSLDKAGMLFLFDLFFAWEGPSASHQRFYAADKHGRFFAMQVLSAEFFELKEKYFGDTQKAHNEFQRRYGLEFGWIASGKRDKTKFEAYEIKNIEWRAENEDILRSLPESNWLLAPDSPEADRDFSTLYAENIKNPRDWLFAANDLLGTVEYNKVKEDNERLYGDDPNEVDRQNRLARNNIRYMRPGFLRNYGGGYLDLEETYREVREKWEDEAYDGIEIVEGYREFLPVIEALEARSMEMSNSENPDWWRTSETQYAESLRIWAYKHAEAIWSGTPDLSEDSAAYEGPGYSDFYYFWWELLVKLVGPGEHLVDYVQEESG